MKKNENVIYPVLPLKDIVIFPNCVNAVSVSRNRSRAALEHAMDSDKKIFVVSQVSARKETPQPRDLYLVGTVVEILQNTFGPDGNARILIEGLYSAKVLNYIDSAQFMQAVVVRENITVKSSKKILALRRVLSKQFEKYAQSSGKVPDDLLVSLKATQDDLTAVNIIANYCPFSNEEKQTILMENHVEGKLMEVVRLLHVENDLLELEEKILSRVHDRIGHGQKDFYLNEQLKVIEQELGISEEDDLEISNYKKKLSRTRMPKEVREKVKSEIARLKKMAPISPDATVASTYIGWLLNMPWNKTTRDRSDLLQAEKILNKNHYGLPKVKERILEYLAVHQLVKNPKSPILCLVGPPGVGKTSLARSIANALGRRFVRISLGGVRDESEIRGHRRTYIGAMPGKIIQSIKKAGSMNPIMLLDEIDKMGYDFRGDPGSALLEVLDPEQNMTYNDHYLDIDFDLSSVMFITTANIAEDIPRTLLDRMELIYLTGYTLSEKVEIAERFLLPRQIREHGLTKRNLKISRDILSYIIAEYTREAGVRNLEREIARICRKVARDMVGKNKKWLETPDVARIRKLLGPPRCYDMKSHDMDECGVATGLAWTEMGGEIMPMETSVVKGKGGLLLTGQLGDVMQESAKAALTYLRSHYEKFNLNSNFASKVDIHIHVPEGAIPKDGPSAGITMAASMLSALSKRPVRPDVAMTGEITLRGKVLRIGGLKDKVLAAHRARINTVILPDDNKNDVEEIPGDVRRNMEFVFVKNLDQVLDAALTSKTRRVKRTPGSR